MKTCASKQKRNQMKKQVDQLLFGTRTKLHQQQTMHKLHGKAR